jgi:radical SAM superfamily enzyme YgiQ (UPF0313 family)
LKKTAIALIQLEGSEVSRDKDQAVLSLYNVAEPLGLLYIDAYLKRIGHKVLLLHPHIEEKQILSYNELLRRATDFLPDLVGFSAMTNQVPRTHEMAMEIKSILPQVRIVVGGDHFSGYPQDILNFDALDFAICGEGEKCMAWLVEHFENLESCEVIPAGIYWKDRNKVHGKGRSKRIQDLDSLPFASRYLGLLKWSRVGMLMWPPRAEQTGMVSINTSRGCPYACAYCDARQVWGVGVHWRKPEKVVEELKALKDAYGINTAFFVDLTFNADREKVFDICQAFEKVKLGISWYVLLRPGNPDNRITVDRPMLEALKKAGCIKVGFGVETLSPSIAKDLRRSSINGYLVKVMRWMDDLGLLSKAFLIIGHPQETEKYYQELSSYLFDLGVDELRISYLVPFPGTPLWDKYQNSLPADVAYEDYTTFRPLMHHPIFSSEELTEIRLSLVRNYYFSSLYQARVKEKVTRYPYLKKSFVEFMDHISASLYGNEFSQMEFAQIQPTNFSLLQVAGQA